MNVLERKISEVQHLVQDENYGYKEAVDKVKYDIDGDELYDMRTGQTVCQDITTATDEQVRDLLQIKKALIKTTTKL
ncbi:hypothetical protein [Clostridium ljungdahlii]|uniref:Uncharacterized protein n=1 Tax=Clostridium ljungdahlii TaxID=1538 RepID=A0A162NB14_9CLOT|nr:hypothetical protein [Clostridium ljungdahlii]OAA91229.1 hypothetical protein WY13_00794 [Clostridium ljungdahlii]